MKDLAIGETYTVIPSTADGKAQRPIRGMSVGHGLIVCNDTTAPVFFPGLITSFWIVIDSKTGLVVSHALRRRDAVRSAFKTIIGGAKKWRAPIDDALGIQRRLATQRAEIRSGKRILGGLVHV